MKPSVVLAVLAISVGLIFIDRSLARLEQSEILGEAQSLFKEGSDLLAAGRAAESTRPLERAHVLQRSRRDYQLMLARAYVSAGRLTDAEAQLLPVLTADSNDGEANLVMARLQVKLGNDREAEAYYHRAVYGKWPVGAAVDEVRMELAEFLADAGQPQKLLAEVLLIQSDARVDLDRQRKIAHLLLVAGSPERAAASYRALLRKNADDVDALTGLAEADMALGEYSAAQDNLRRAQRLRPDDSQIRARMELAGLLSSLDPTPRRLASKEKFERSVRVLELAKADLRMCAQLKGAMARLQPALDDVELKQKQMHSMNNESAEVLLDFAQSLWRSRQQTCSTPVPESDPLPLLISKIGQ
ncbi:tetratricopeptide repeat protein [uncultured Paludibaculum sp.]|uniref:tetratricopeptide repeat protein n=1 Tax=uncultured Paludibaculum sp. TaxID=1765020 RepID=UPI002AAB34D7|nr:tetratricopeptide repeat protein [uncultured Paludibaculum sp.]